jgi:hypothetical protein
MTLPRTIAAVVLLLVAPGTPAQAWERGHVETFATLPAGTHNPEGITADRRGHIYVTTFDVTKTGGPGDLLVFGGGKQVLAVNPFTGASSVFTTIPGGANAGPNVLTFDHAGNVYISDSFQGTIWRTGPGGGAPTAWVTDPLLTTTGVPPFGANGLAFNNAGDALFVCNTGNDSVVRIPVAGGNASAPTAFAYNINGCDGLIIDDDDNLWIAANQADEIAVLNPSGRVVAKLGDFDGINRHGEPIGLLFPASLVRHGHHIYVTNLSLDLRLFGFPAVDAQWAADVQRHTIARIPARIPKVKGLK